MLPNVPASGSSLFIGRNLPAAGLDHLGSAKNTGKRTATFYEHTNYHGARFSLAPGESQAHFGNVGMSDKTGSVIGPVRSGAGCQ